MNNRSMPASTVIPVLVYDDVKNAVEWLCRSFGFTERLRVFDHRVQLNVGSGHVVVCDGGPVVPSGHSIMVRVGDVEAHCQRATANGARIVNPPTDYPYGERQYTAEDIGGHRWTFSESIADVDPAAWGGVPVE
jgi:uncharacterized glyoxalase superfamily protein PhnB